MLVAVGLHDRGMVGQAFTFRLPDAKDVPYGAWVRVPMAGKTMRGVILGPGEAMSEDVVIQDVLAIEQHPLGFQLKPWQCQLILWMAAFYYSPVHKVLRLFIPAPLWQQRFEPKEQLMIAAAAQEEVIPARQKQGRALLRRLQEGPMPYTELRKEFSNAVYTKAKEAGFVTVTSLGLLPVRPWKGSLSEVRRLTVEQQKIVDTMEASHPQAALLYGITGAGKTEMYLHRALQMREKRLQTALLVPEIALTPQLVSYFQRIFGARVAIVHSHLAEGEKCQEWLRVARHEVDVVIGSRSALFAPYAALGLIILDEEHEWTYKNEQNPRYLTHRVAEWIGESLHVGVLFASGTPSIERFARARGDTKDASRLALYPLEERIYDQTPAA